jgi:hypothetical protein
MFGLKPNTPAWDIYQQRIDAIRDVGKWSREEFSRAAGYPEGELAPVKDYSTFVKSTRRIDPKIDRAAQEYAVREAYNRAADEVLARTAQKELTMSPQELSVWPPFSTMEKDVPFDKQIVRYGSSGRFTVPPLRFGSLAGRRR